MAVEIVPIEISVKAKADVKPISKIKEKANEAASATNKISKNMKKISTESKHSQNAFSKLGSSIKRILLYRAIRTALRQITQAFSEGVKNLYQYSKAMNGSFANAMDRAATSLLYFKNALGTLAAPLIEMAVPLLEKGIDVIVDIINKINEAIAALRGQATYTRAIKYWIKYAEAAEKAKSATIGIDELNVIGDNNGNQLDYTKMFEEAEVELTGLKDAWDGIFSPEKLKSIGNNIKTNIIDPIVASVPSLFGSWMANIYPLIDDIKTRFLDTLDQITASPFFAEAWDVVTEALTTIWEIAGELKPIINDIWDVLDEMIGDLLPFWTMQLKGTKVLIVLLKAMLMPILDWTIYQVRLLLLGVKTLWQILIQPLKNLTNIIANIIKMIKGEISPVEAVKNIVKYSAESQAEIAKGAADSFINITKNYGTSLNNHIISGAFDIADVVAEVSGVEGLFDKPQNGKTEVTTTINVDSRTLATVVSKGNVKKGANFVRGYVM